MIKTKIILFCYSYIVGIGLCMLIPLDVHFLPYLWALVAMAMAGMILRSYYDRRAPRPAGVDEAPTSKSTWAWIVIAPLLLGYTRYISANTLPDSRLGTLEIVNSQPSYVAVAGLDDTYRLRLQKTEALDSDLRVRLVGELRARVPIVSETGTPLLDDQARWRFREVVTEQASEVIEIKKDDPVGMDYVVPQPFNKLDRVEVLSGPANARVAVYRISNHISSFVRYGRNQTPVTILARITTDPWLYSFKTVLTVTPYYVQYRPNGPYFKVDGGDIRITIGPDSENYNQFACTMAYGYDIVIHGGLTMAGGKANPAGFDQRQYLNNYGVFGQMSLKQFLGGPPPVVAVPLPDGQLRHGNPMVEFSLEIRDRLCRVFKQTLPYPSSAFLGGIALGLRYGLQSTECMMSSLNPNSGSHRLLGNHADCHELIADEFRVAGVNHVLAVSGLHVTIITIMFVGIFTLLRMSRRVYVPIIVMALVVFAILTGARPSSLRAVIMNSLFLLTWAYLDKGLRSSALTGVPVAAFLILLDNPNVVVDPSFTLSFMAILALVLMTGPSYEFLCWFKGNDVISLFLIIGLWTASVIMSWHLMSSLQYWILFTLACAAIFGLGRLLTRFNIRLIGDKGFSDIPYGVATFMAAQLAIQFGMMVPLSPFYFCRWPVAGSFANLIAIPLVGVVLQVGVIGALLGLIPVVGIWIALLMNAANWVFGAGFLLIAHYCTKWFPYPLVPRPTVRWLVVYFMVVSLFVWWKPWYRWASGYVKSQPPRKRVQLGVFFSLAVILLLVWAINPTQFIGKSGLNITVLSVRYGSSILIETPGGKKIVVDAAFVQRDQSRANEAERNIITFLTTKGIRHLDGLILTSPRLERAAGVPYVLDRCRVDNFYTPPSLANLATNIPPEEFAANLGAGLESISAMYAELIGTPSAPRQFSTAKILANRGPTFINRLANAVIRHQVVKAGDVLFREEVKGCEFAIEILAPDGAPYAANTLDNQSMVVRVRYGDFAMLLPSDLHFEGQQRLLDTYDETALQSEVVVMPNRGVALPAGASFMVDMKASLRDALKATTIPFFDKVGAEYAIFEFGNPRPVMGLASRDTVKVYEIARREICDFLGDDRVLNTDMDMTIFIHSDGQSYTVDTQAQTLRDTSSEEFESFDEMIDVP